MPVTPLTPEQVTQLNNLGGGYPPTPQLGTLLNDIIAAGGEVNVVADNAARLAGTYSEGELVYQADTAVLYTYDGVNNRLRVLDMPSLPDPFFGASFPSVYFYIDPVGGNDANDGRSETTQKASLSGVFQDLNEAGHVDGFVQIYCEPGTTVETNLRLSAAIRDDIFLNARPSTFASTQQITYTGAGVLVNTGGYTRANIYDRPTSGFAGPIAWGQGFKWRNDGFSPSQDIFPAFREPALASTSPTLRSVGNTGSDTTINFSDYEAVIAVPFAGIVVEQAVLTISGMHVDYGGTSPSLSAANVRMIACKVTANAGVTMNVLAERSRFQPWNNSFIDIGNRLLSFRTGQGATCGISNSAFRNAQLQAFEGLVTFDGLFEGVTVAGAPDRFATTSLGRCDVESIAGTWCSAAVGALRVAGNISHDGSPTTLLALTDNCDGERTAGVVTQPGPTAGVAVTVRDGAVFRNLSALAGLTGTGGDVTVGGNAPVLLAALPTTDLALGNTSEIARAT